MEMYYSIPVNGVMLSQSSSYILLVLRPHIITGTAGAGVIYKTESLALCRNCDGTSYN